MMWTVHWCVITLLFMRCLSSPIRQRSTQLVAFSVSRTTSLQAAANAVTITHDLTNANVGDGYDRFTGHFTAPVAGYYLLSMSEYLEASNGQTTDSYSFVRMRKNGGILTTVAGKITGHANQVIVHLQVGDNVWTELVAHCKIYSSSSKYVTFSGVLS